MEVLKTTSPVTSTGAPKLFPRKMVPSSRASTAALPSSTIVVSKVAHLGRGPFQVFSKIAVSVVFQDFFDECEQCAGRGVIGQYTVTECIVKTHYQWLL